MNTDFHFNATRINTRYFNWRMASSENITQSCRNKKKTYSSHFDISDELLLP